MFFFFFKQKTAYEMRISDWSSDVCSSDLQTGTLNMNQPIHALDRDGKIVETGRATKIMAFRGLDRVPVESAKAGDIISLAGLTVATVANTIADVSVSE